jgi:hypothetical protein
MVTNHRIPGTEIFASIATHHKPCLTAASFANHRQQPQPSPTTQRHPTAQNPQICKLCSNSPTRPAARFPR